MSITKPNDRTGIEQKHYLWHALPGIIGDAIVEGPGANIACGEYHVIHEDDGVIVIYREVDIAYTESELEPSDLTWDWGDYSASYEQIAEIPPPAGGWKAQLEEIPDDIWDGYG